MEEGRVDIKLKEAEAANFKKHYYRYLTHTDHRHTTLNHKVTHGDGVKSAAEEEENHTSIKNRREVVVATN